MVNHQTALHHDTLHYTLSSNTRNHTKSQVEKSKGCSWQEALLRNGVPVADVVAPGPAHHPAERPPHAAALLAALAVAVAPRLSHALLLLRRARVPRLCGRRAQRALPPHPALPPPLPPPLLASAATPHALAAALLRRLRRPRPRRCAIPAVGVALPKPLGRGHLQRPPRRVDAPRRHAPGLARGAPVLLVAPPEAARRGGAPGVPRAPGRRGGPPGALVAGAEAAHERGVPAWRRGVGVGAVLPPGHLRHARARPGTQGAPPCRPHGLLPREGVLPPDRQAVEARLPLARPARLGKVFAHRGHGEPPPLRRVRPRAHPCGHQRGPPRAPNPDHQPVAHCHRGHRLLPPPHWRPRPSLREAAQETQAPRRFLQRRLIRLGRRRRCQWRRQPPGQGDAVRPPQLH
uniref:Uncharacterized protein n=1 Tax=Zea mays TaxID=4577 RepID=A0A804Q955_MAIZE